MRIRVTFDANDRSIGRMVEVDAGDLKILDLEIADQDAVISIAVYAVVARKPELSILNADAAPRDEATLSEVGWTWVARTRSKLDHASMHGLRLKPAV